MFWHCCQYVHSDFLTRLVFNYLLQTKRLKIAQSLPMADTLVQELLNFKEKIDPKTAHDSYAAWREGIHDDLVLATAVACWYGEKGPQPRNETVVSSGVKRVTAELFGDDNEYGVGRRSNKRILSIGARIGGWSY